MILYQYALDLYLINLAIFAFYQSLFQSIHHFWVIPGEQYAEPPLPPALSLQP